MKKLLFLFIIFPFLSFAQQSKGINFLKSRWNDALSEAKKQNKLIFVDIYTTWCGPCKIMSNQVFVTDKVGEKFNQSFVNFKIDAEKGEGIELAQKYLITAYPTYLFVHHSGELVYRSLGAMSAEKFILEADKALQASKGYRSTAEIEKDFQSTKNNPEILLEYLKKKKLNGENVEDLLDSYLKAIPESNYKTEKVLTLIAENNTSITSKAFEILVQSQKRLLSMTKDQQMAVIRGIANAKRRTFSQVVKNKDKAQLEKLIEVVKATSMSKPTAEMEELQFRYDFAKSTKDTEAFKQIAQKEAPKLMKKTKEQLMKESAQGLRLAKMGAKMNGIDSTSFEYKSMVDALENGAIRTTSFQLNDYAWGYYQMVNTQIDLEQALLWATRAIELMPSPANLDTQAHLFYKLGRIKEAISAQKRAIKLAKHEGGNTVELEKVLKDIKKERL